MVVYQPPDEVFIAIGAAYRAEPMLAAEARLGPILEKDVATLTPFGFSEDEVVSVRRMARELRTMMKDPKLAKNDTPVQMEKVPETMAQIRAWLVTLRQLASINLAVDTPALERLASPAPELADSYPRDLLEELDRRIMAASDLKPRLEEIGLTAPFVGRGRKLGMQLRTALGQRDIDPANLGIGLRRFYNRKARLLLRLKRGVRAGHVAFALVDERRALYHLTEIEPLVIEPAPGAVRPRGSK